MRKKDETLRETLLDCAREIADTNGIAALNVRSLSRKAGIAAGTVYHYFSGKDEILLVLTEEYWKKTILEMQGAITAPDFCGQLEQIFYYLKKKIAGSAGSLMQELGTILPAAGMERMRSMQSALEAALIRLMDQDKAVRQDIWNETFSKEQYAGFIVMNITMLLQSQADDICFFTEIVRRTLYKTKE